MSGETDDFAALMARAAEGDPAAQDLLCRHYEAKVRVVARVLLGPALRPYLDSVDLVQSVHRSLLLGLRDEKFDISSPEKLVALASTIVRRKVARNWRKHRRQQRIVPRETDSRPLVQELLDLSVHDADPSAAAQYREQMERLCQTLNATERRMLAMRLDGYTTAEVAQELGLHPVALRVRWTRLRQRLQAAGVLAELL